MIRLLNFSCFALTALACLALYHISEQTRIAKVELHSVQEQIADRSAMATPQSVAAPSAPAAAFESADTGVAPATVTDADGPVADGAFGTLFRAYARTPAVTDRTPPSRVPGDPRGTTDHDEPTED